MEMLKNAESIWKKSKMDRKKHCKRELVYKLSKRIVDYYICKMCYSFFENFRKAVDTCIQV